MGREIKRVPLDFDWPMNKVWYGYFFSGCFEGSDSFTCEDCKRYAKIKGISCGEHDYSCPDWNFDNEPPKGYGFQMWETTSEGSPMSPVFAAPEELARWLVDNNASSFGNDTATYGQWLAMIGQE